MRSWNYKIEVPCPVDEAYGWFKGDNVQNFHILSHVIWVNLNDDNSVFFLVKIANKFTHYNAKISPDDSKHVVSWNDGGENGGKLTFAPAKSDKNKTTITAEITYPGDSVIQIVDEELAPSEPGGKRTSKPVLVQFFGRIPPPPFGMTAVRR